jgi:hypothetical protein
VLISTRRAGVDDGVERVDRYPRNSLCSTRVRQPTSWSFCAGPMSATEAPGHSRRFGSVWAGVLANEAANEAEFSLSPMAQKLKTPTAEQRKLVETMAAVGMRQARVHSAAGLRCNRRNMRQSHFAVVPPLQSI